MDSTGSRSLCTLEETNCFNIDQANCNCSYLSGYKKITSFEQFSPFVWRTWLCIIKKTNIYKNAKVYNVCPTLKAEGNVTDCA